MTHQERLLCLAGELLLKPGFPDTPRFPTLRQECPRCEGTGEIVRCSISEHCRMRREDGKQYCEEHGATIIQTGCPLCQGRKWTPVDSLEATLSCTFQWRFDGRVSHRRSDDIRAYCRLTPQSEDSAGLGETHNEAATQALYQAVQGEK